MYFRSETKLEEKWVIINLAIIIGKNDIVEKECGYRDGGF